MNEFNSTEALVKVLTENLKQQKRTSRWRALTRFFSLIIFVFFLSMMIKSIISANDGIYTDLSKPHTAVISVKGTIAEDSFFGSSEQVISALQKAFEEPNVKGVILDLNSPGGSPVQSDLIYNEIKRLQAEDKEKRKIYSVVSDVCASGCYYLAAATDQIYANDLSTVGSIGVLFSSFGATELLKKVGIDRRLQTAGKYKAFLDPFSEETEESKQIIQQHLKVVHDVFIERVITGRKDRIKKNNPDIFSGLFWTGQQSIELGLVDDIKTKAEVAKEIIGAEKMIDYTSKPTLSDVMSSNFSRVSLYSGVNALDSQVELLKKWVS